MLLQITSLNVRLKDINDAGLTGGFGSILSVHNSTKMMLRTAAYTITRGFFRIILGGFNR